MKRIHPNIIKFIYFSLISLCGWLLDFISFLTLTNYINISISYANFISSYVGVTFVWFLALSAIFKTQVKNNNKFLFIYWGYQFISIFFYSYLIIFFQYLPIIFRISNYLGLEWQAIAKIIITPFNLLTNYSFMHLLTLIIKKRTSNVE